jgi:hypothetical protein
MSEFKITSNLSGIKCLIELLESKPVINETSYVFDKKFKSQVTFNLPLFDRSEFDRTKILDYINATECIKIDGLREQLLSGFKQVLLMDDHNFDNKLFKGKYSIDIPKEIKPADLQKCIDEQVRKANYQCFQDTMARDDKFGWDEMAVNEHTKLMEHMVVTRSDLANVLQTYMDTDEEDDVNDINSDDLAVIADVHGNDDLSLPTTSKTKQTKKEIKFDDHTEKILDCIPFGNNNVIFSGGLLYDNIILKHKVFNIGNMNERSSLDVDKLADIDLFIFGDNTDKLKTINDIIHRISDLRLPMFVGINGSVIDIFIQGIPRIVQIICTNYKTANEVINKFDLCHLMSYFDGKHIIYTYKSNECILNNRAKINENYGKRLKYSRILKTISRGLNVDNLLQNVNVFSQNDCNHYHKYLEQVKYYADTHNLTDSFDKKEIFELFNLIAYNSNNIVLDGNFDNYTRSKGSDNDIHEDKINEMVITGRIQLKNKDMDSVKFSGCKNLLFKGRVICSSSKFNHGHEDYPTRILFEVTDSKFISYFISVINKMKDLMLKSGIKFDRFNVPVKPSKAFDPYKYYEFVNNTVLKHDEIPNYRQSSFDKYLGTLNGLVLTVIFENDPKYVTDQEILLGVRLNVYSGTMVCGINLHNVKSVPITK